MMHPPFSTITKFSRRCYTRFSYKHAPGDAPLKHQTVGQLLEIAAHKYDTTSAIISCHQRKQYTFRQLLHDADQLAAGLYKIGLRRGDRVGLWAPNVAEWPVAKYACARAGFVMAALNPLYEAPEIEYCINKVGIKTIICVDKLKEKHNNYYETLQKVAPELNACKPGELHSARVPSLRSVIVISEKYFAGALNFWDVLQLPDTFDVERIRNEQTAIDVFAGYQIQFSSGTTGKPKAALITHFNAVNNSREFGKRQGLHAKEHRVCVQNPLFHAFGLYPSLIASLTYGTCVVLPSETYSPSANLRAIEQEGCTIIHGTPTMYVDLINVQRQLQASIHPEIALLGGAPCSPVLFNDIKKTLQLKHIRSIYGLSETTAVCFSSLPDEDERMAMETVGSLGDHLEAKVVDLDGNLVPFGAAGELCVRGYCVMAGYWGDPAKTSEIMRDGWLHTGDQFVLHENGYGQVVGRLKDMIIRGGENIFPKEVEDVLNTHPNILESQVVGLPHERLGEEVCACVRLKTNGTLTMDELKSYCRGKISTEKIPSQLRILDAFPKTTSDANGCVKCWNHSFQQCVYTIREKRQTFGLTYHPRLPKFVTYGDDMRIFLYDEETRMQERILAPSGITGEADGHVSRIFAACFHPRNNYELITGGWDDIVQYWDLRQPYALRHLSGIHICGEGLDISPNGKEILTCAWQAENPLQLWDYDSGNLIASMEPDEHKSLLYTGKYLTSEFVMVGGCDKNLIRLIDLNNFSTTSSINNLPGGVYSIDIGPAKHRKKVTADTVKSKAQEIAELPKTAFCSGKKVYQIDFA